MFGRVSVAERVWSTKHTKYLRLLPEAIGVSPRGRSQRLERVLTDFGSEHSFQHAAARVLEHYGFEMNVSAVRHATLHHAGRAEQILKEEYQKPFRALPAVAEPYVIAETDGSMLCTVGPGPRTGKKPREWKEIRLAAARGLTKTDTCYAATFGEVAEVGRRGGTVRFGPAGDSTVRSTRWAMEPNGYGYRPGRSLVSKPPSCATIIMSASIWQRRLQLAEPRRRSVGVEPNRTGSNEAR